MNADLPLCLREVEVYFGPRAALRGVDLDAHRGEFVALVGPNGSGKTTLLRAVLGLVRSNRGTIQVLGDRVEELSIHQRARRIAWVPQEESPTDNVALIDYVLYGRYPYQRFLEPDRSEDRASAERLLEEVGLSDRAHEGILGLSGGERQSAVVARALAQETPLLLLDEPTSHLDIGHQLDLLGRVKTLARTRGITVVAALHDLNLAARFSDRIVVLSRGRKVADGPPTEVLSPAILREVWGVTAELRREVASGTPYLIPHRLSPPATPALPPAGFGPIHVVGGGGAAASYLRALADAGYRLSAGALHLLDTDAEAAEGLAVPTAIEAPFAPLGEAARAQNRLLLERARAVVVTAFPVGPSNLANLQDVLVISGRLPVYAVRHPEITARDHTGGRATELYRQLIAAGATEIESPEELLERLRDLAASCALPSPGTGPPVPGPAR